MNNIPTITRNLLVINVVVFLATYAFRGLGIDLNDLLGLHFMLAPDFHFYQLFTYMFAHGGWSHIFFNMFALWMFGCIVERTWGARKFLFYYIACGIGAGLFQELAQMVQFYMLATEHIQGFTLSQTMLVAKASATLLNAWTTVGASGAIYGILLAFGMLFPDERIFIFPLPVPIKAKWFVILYAALELSLGLGMPGDSVAHFAHLGGMLFGYLLIRYWRKNRYGGGMYGYGDRSQSIFGKMKDYWEKHTGKNASRFNTTSRRETDWEYNARKKKEQDEVDRILDKVRKSGYDSLSA